MRGHGGDDAQPKHTQSKHLRYAEVQRDLGQQRSGEEQCAGREQAAEGGGHSGNTEGTAGLPQFGGHGITIQAGGGRVGSTRRIDEDGGDGASIDGAAESAQQHHNACLIKGKSKRE